MKQITKEGLRECANKLMFELSDEQVDRLYNEFSIIIEQMSLIGEIPGVDEAAPMTFPFDVTNTFLREDVAAKPLDREDALRNAKDVVDGQIRLPKVVG